MSRNGQRSSPEPWAAPKYPTCSDDTRNVHHGELYVFGALVIAALGDRLVLAIWRGIK